MWEMPVSGGTFLTAFPGCDVIPALVKIGISWRTVALMAGRRMGIRGVDAMDYTEIAKTFGAFFAIMNPFVNLPIFLSLTSSYSVAQQRTLAVKVILFSAVMCLVILAAGQMIISFFGITIDQFRIAGGAVLAHIAWSMLNGEAAPSHHGTEEEKDDMKELSGLAFYPITFPMVVGPGTIATLIIYASHATTYSGYVEVAAVVGVILAILFLVMFFASALGEVLSDTMRVITTRLMGMILLAISVDMMVAGLKVVLPGLG
jgi:multiple antibiotic resistance protein